MGPQWHNLLVRSSWDRPLSIYQLGFLDFVSLSSLHGAIKVWISLNYVLSDCPGEPMHSPKLGQVVQRVGLLGGPRYDWSPKMCRPVAHCLSVENGISMVVNLTRRKIRSAKTALLAGRYSIAPYKTSNSKLRSAFDRGLTPVGRIVP